MGLLVVPNMHDSPADHEGLSRLARGLISFVLLSAPVAENRGKNRNALFALIHKPSELIPCADTSDMCGIGTGSDNAHDVRKAVPMELRHGGEKSGESFAFARFKLPHEMVNRLLLSRHVTPHPRAQHGLYFSSGAYNSSCKETMP